MPNSPRGLCFTLNNYSDEEIAICMGFDFTYCVFGFEIGESGNPHIQGYCYNRNGLTIKKLKGLLPRAHIEVQKGTTLDAIAYCMKDEDFYEIGTRPRQGRRSDLDMIRYDIERGKTDLEIAKSNFSQWCFHRRSFAEYRKLTVSYKTILVIFTPSVISSCKSAGEYKKIPDSIFYDHMEFQWPEYFSDRYKYIITPRTASLDDTIACDELDGKYIKYIYV